MQAVNDSADETSLAILIERSSELKQALVSFACGPRCERQLTRLMLEAAGPAGELDEGEAVNVIDRFALHGRLPSGKTILDQFLATQPDLTAADYALVNGWRDPVEGIFEVRGKDRDAVTLLNLLDDLEYRVYSNMGPAVFRPLSRNSFVYTRLVRLRPQPASWLVSGTVAAYPKSSAARVAQTAIQLAAANPELVYRNPERLQNGWQQMHADRAAFIEFFGGDELVLRPAEAAERLRAYYRHRQEASLAGQPGRRRSRDTGGMDTFAFDLPADIADADTVGVIYDEVDGLNFYRDYGMLRDLFADPALVADKRYSQVLREYLKAETVSPLPFLRLAAAYPRTVDAVFRKVLRDRHFTWGEHGEELLRRRKPWYYEQERRPGVSVIGTRLSELAKRR